MDAPPTYADACDDPAKSPPEVRYLLAVAASRHCGPDFREANVTANEGQMMGSDTPVTDSQAGEFTSKHVVLVGGIASADGSLEQGSIHHWQHGTSSPFAMPTKLSLDDMRHIFGFLELGTFSIPASQSPIQERHEFLTSLMGEGGHPVQQSVEADQELIDYTIAKLETADPAYASEEEAAAKLKLCSFEILIRGEAGLAGGNTDEMVWNWAKPASLYLTEGSWYRTMDEAVVDGVWRAGMGFSIHVEAVGTNRKGRMFELGHGR